MPLVTIHVFKGAASTNFRRCSSPTMSLSKRSAFRAEIGIRYWRSTRDRIFKSLIPALGWIGPKDSLLSKA